MVCRNGEMSLTLELLRMETDRDLFWPYSAGNGLISAVPHDCPKAAKKANTNSSNQALVNNNNSLSKVRAGLSTHKRHSYCKFLTIEKKRFRGRIRNFLYNKLCHIVTYIFQLFFCAFD